MDTPGSPETDVADAIRDPRRYKVLLHNDDYTTMDFVVRVLMQLFHMDEAQATRTMLAIHKDGVAVAGVYTSEMAETKVALVHAMARKEGYPLRSSMEEA